MAQTSIVRGVATTIRGEDGYTIVRYHSTDVVKFDDCQIILNSGKWQTVTTKLRMNQTSNQFGLGYGVYQRKHQWYVSYKGIELAFYDGMVLER